MENRCVPAFRRLRRGCSSWHGEAHHATDPTGPAAIPRKSHIRPRSCRWPMMRAISTAPSSRPARRGVTFLSLGLATVQTVGDLVRRAGWGAAPTSAQNATAIHAGHARPPQSIVGHQSPGKILGTGTHTAGWRSYTARYSRLQQFCNRGRARARCCLSRRS